MLLNAYYLRHHMYTLVPRHVREDMAWMADLGTDIVSIGILEQDLFASQYNLDIICQEADRAGLSVHAVPSRWGGVVAGAPKVPSLFTATHPETWIVDADGRPVYGEVWGPMSSVHHPDTFALYAESLRQMLTQWPIKGIVWDEVKILDVVDRSPAARDAQPPGADASAHIDAVADFFDRAGREARKHNPDLLLSMFIYAFIEGYAVERCARLAALDYFGCDGKPWRLEDYDRPVKKTLLGMGERFLAEARKNGKGGLFLIENLDMSLKECEIMDRRLPEVLALRPEQLIYYYYPRNMEDPDRQMAILAKHLRAAKAGTV